MGVFKEEAHIFETVAKYQDRIYNDAADYGFPYDTNNVPKNVQAVFDIIAEFKEIDNQGGRKVKKFINNRQTWGEGKTKGVSVDVIIYWEENEGYLHGTKCSISFNNTAGHYTKFKPDCDAFISIYVEPYKEKV